MMMRPWLLLSSAIVLTATTTTVTTVNAAPDLLTDGYQYWTAPMINPSDVVVSSMATGVWDPTSTSYQLLGWHANFSEAGGTAQCKGSYQAVSQVPLDPSGQTCYVNPVADPTDVAPGVIWFSSLPTLANNTPRPPGIYTWFAVFNSNINYTDYMPSPCQDDGVCECGGFDLIRVGWSDPKDGDVLFFGVAGNETDNTVESDVVTMVGVMGTSYAADNCDIRLTATLMFSLNETTKETTTLQRFAVMQVGMSEAPVIPPGSLTIPPNNTNTTSSSSIVVSSFPVLSSLSAVALFSMTFLS